MRVGLTTVALVGVALIGAGCGGSQPDEAVRGYFEAIVEGDGERACDQLSEELRADIDGSPAVEGAGRSCADVMRLAAGLNPALSTRDVEELEIEVEEDGDRATATLQNPLVERDETLALVKEDGDWKISRLETRPRG